MWNHCRLLWLLLWLSESLLLSESGLRSVLLWRESLRLRVCLLLTESILRLSEILLSESLLWLLVCWCQEVNV